MKIRQNSNLYDLDCNTEYMFICARNLNNVSSGEKFTDVNSALKNKKEDQSIFVFELVYLNNIVPSSMEFTNSIARFAFEQTPSTSYLHGFSILNEFERIPEFKKVKKAYEKFLKKTSEYYIPGMYLGILENEV